MHAVRSQPAIVAGGLRKAFGGQVVLDGIDLHVAARPQPSTSCPR
jgi:ABC-type transporter Mla maintaining outer membrane lipid asymmetry ATPase subunit MlaF